MWWCVLLTLAGVVTAQTGDPVDCSDKENGYAFWGCKAFHRCNRGRAEYVECGSGQVFNEEIGDCSNVEQVRTPCGMDLFGRCPQQDGPYARGVAVREYQENNNGRSLRCTYFFVCYRGINYGTQKCSGGNVFDETQQFCVDPRTLSDECGLQDGPPRRG